MEKDTSRESPFPPPSLVRTTRMGGILEAMRRWLGQWMPPPVGTNAVECLRMSVGIGLGLLVTALLSRWWDGMHGAHSPAWMVASLSASAVLVFGMPASPLAQPWPVLGGSVVSLLTAALCQTWISDDALALALCVATSVSMMVALRCLHPPGVGLAAFVILEHAPAMQMLAFPVLFNVTALLLCAVAYNRITGRAYPYAQRVMSNLPESQRFTAADLDAALSNYNQVLDISRADLEALLHHIGRAAFERTLGDLRCVAVMSHPVIATAPHTSIQAAWGLMRSHQVKALPVIDDDRNVVGIVAHADFVRIASNLQPASGLGQRLRKMLLRQGGNSTAKTVADIMSSPAQLASEQQPVIALVPLFSAGGHHHLPVVDAQEQLTGIITQTDLIRVLASTVAPALQEGLTHESMAA